jgi:hypothetical protein
LAAAFLYGFFAGMAEQTFYILPDGLMPFMATLVLAVACWCARRDKPAAYAVLGLVLGLAANLRSDALGIGVFLALGIWRWRRRLDRGTLARVGIMAFAAFVLLIPYGLLQRNVKSIGRFHVTTLALGQSLWMAYGETPNPHGAVVSDAAVAEMLYYKTGRYINQLPEGEAVLRRLWLRAAVREPRWFLWSVSNRSGRLVASWRAAVEPPFTAPARSSSAYRHLIELFNGGVATLIAGVLSCAIVAVLFSRPGPLIAAVPLTYLFAFSLLHLERRYVIPSLGPLVFAGCYGASLSVAWVRRMIRRDAVVPNQNGGGL